MTVLIDRDGWPTLELRKRCLARFEEECAATEIENADLSISGQGIQDAKKEA